MHWNGGWTMMGGMWIFWIVLILLIALLAVWLVRVSAGGGDGARAPRSSSAEEILKERYARGDIDKEEYERRLRDIRR